MTPNNTYTTRSQASVWHPCTQMKHHERFPLVPIARGQGVWLVDFDDRRYLDAVSSWWVNLFGHANPRINRALKNQLDTLEHAMLAGFTHQPVIELSERLASLTGLGHAFYGSDGASATEIALKMSFHYWRNQGLPDKQKFISLEGSYHGETLGALAVTDVALFRDAYGPLLNQNVLVPMPVEPPTTRLFGQLSNDTQAASSLESALHALENRLAEEHQRIAAFIVEPLLQGAAGMRFYPATYLARARELCNRYQVHLIADEIMTGFGRTGSLFACEQVISPQGPGLDPDFLCLSKGITGGYLPLSCVLTRDNIYQAFYSDDTSRGFLHSHSYTGSALACRAALATLDIFKEDDIINQNRAKAARFNQIAAPLAAHPRVRGFRHLGMIWAFEVESSAPQFARDFFSRALARGILLRPIGYTVYFMPPYIISDEEFAWLVAETIHILDQLPVP